MDDLLRKYERAQVVSPGTQSIVQSSTPPVSTRRQEPEHFQVRDLPNQGLFVSSPGAWVNSSSPFRFRYECQRVALVNSLPVEEVAPRYHSRFDDIDTLWAHFKEDNLILPKQPSQQAWGASVGDFREVTLKGSLSINPKNTGSLFKLSLEPLHIDISSRFQRAWGGDRFLYLNVPSFQGLKNHLSGPKQQQHLHNRYHEWLLTEKQFLGRTWRVLLLETKKPKKCGKRDKESAAQRLILFATHGCTLSPAPTAKRNDASIRDLIHWFMPLDKNRDQPYCKAYARLELGFSRTTPAITLKPSQVLYVPDKLPSPKFEEATEFDDHTLWRPYKVDQKNVMNDGCSIMSVGMAIYIWKTMNLPGQIPSAFQGRIGGAKGVWMLSAAVNTADAHHRDIWIEITESQRKFQPHDEDQDRCDATFEPHRLTFDVVAYTKATQSSTLHVAFLPILLDRGIPAKDLKSLMDHYLEAERIDLLEKMRNPVQTRQWISSEFSDITGQHGITWQAGLPEGISQRAKFLLDSGFDPKQLKTLAADMISLVETHLTKLKQSLSLQVSRSTYTMGVADPLGVLQPGEIHLAFSKTFVDEVNQESYQFLKDVDVLVARHPALRRSDIQRVQAVYKIELAHLVDVVVFPSTGSFPLASKLQGGDYDGDTFWLCWEPILTRNFKNAPAPYTSPSPHQYGISVDKRELKSLLGPQHSVDGFLSKVFEFRARRGVLGIATNFHEKVSYWENSIASPGIERLADIHDLLVDSSKNGYTFEESKWREFVNNCEDIVIKAPKEPAYKSAVQWNAQRHSSGPGSMNNQYKKDHIIDQIYFEHVLPKCDEILKDIGIVFENTVESDADLESLYLEENLHADQAINAELAELVKALKDLHAFYVNLVRPRHNFNGSEVERDSYASSIQKCFEKYENISPSRTDDRVIRSWLRKRSKGSFTYWSLLKASALWSKRKENQRFVLSIAGRELAQLKAESDDNFRTVIGAMYANMKPRKFKASPPTEAISKNEDSDYESALEDQGV
ncbi:hypothetical protein M501DRAFT_924191 [Patellaria atrata CBS 101060]|uniref:RNA-dependent RNA polymerase n=1 Tax=Patellaria atrata CBS 101060 TaxID=1346257 RepID=A0A9P4VS23_9PEZI|nr:hypothetical protein M501DRAFT_924191 [Patellaria atrata CBS 101060]